MRNPQRLRPTDLRILSYLRAHARAPLTTIASATRLPISTVHDRLKIVHGKLVKRQVTHAHFPLLGYLIRCFTAMRVASGDRQALREYLEIHPNLNSLFHINNGYDFLMETYFPQVPDFEKFLNALTVKFRIKHLQAYYVIDELAAEQFLSTPAHLALLPVKMP